MNRSKSTEKQKNKKSINKPLNKRSTTNNKKSTKNKSTTKTHKKTTKKNESKNEEDTSKPDPGNKILKQLGQISHDFGPKRIRLGICCVNNYLKNTKPTVFCGRTMTLQTFKQKGKNEAIERAVKNCEDILKLIEWNRSHYIECLRVSSDLFPHFTNLKHLSEEERYTLDFAKDILLKAGNLARKYGHRLTMHPGQFNVVGSPKEEVFKSTSFELKMHADILDYMGTDFNSVIVVHGGGVYGDKDKTIERWCQNWKKLPTNVKNRLVIENDEKNFSIIDCLKVNKEIGIPIVFDNHHFECYKIYHPDEKFDNIENYISEVIDIWKKKGLRPKFHLSEQNSTNKIVGTHSEYIKTFPEYYLEIPNKFGIGADIMVEAKAKEAAIIDLYKRYQNHFLSHADKNVEEIFSIDKENIQAKKCPRCE